MCFCTLRSVTRLKRSKIPNRQNKVMLWLRSCLSWTLGRKPAVTVPELRLCLKWEDQHQQNLISRSLYKMTWMLWGNLWRQAILRMVDLFSFWIVKLVSSSLLKSYAKLFLKLPKKLIRIKVLPSQYFSAAMAEWEIVMATEQAIGALTIKEISLSTTKVTISL